MDPKTRIIDTACRLFYEQGYNSTGINQVIKEAGVAKASLYQHFPSKEDLLAEYLKVSSATTSQTLQSVMEKYTDPREKIIGLFDFLLKFTKQTKFLGCNFLNVAAEIPKDNRKVRALIRKQKNSIRKMFTELLVPLGKQYLADELYILFDAALVSSKVYGETWPVNTTIKIVKKLI